MGIGVGIVGLGMFGASWIHHYKIHPDVERLALCDLRADVLAAQAQKHGISETYASLDDICKSDLDALVIITQPWLHAGQAIQAMNAGKHAYTAVPAANTLDECDALVRTVERTGMIYMNGETSYFRPTAAFCRKKAAEGAFGEFIYGEAEYFHDMSHGLYDICRKRWGDQWSEDKAGGVPMHYPTHSTSFIISVMRAHMVSVSARGFTLPGDDWFREDTIYRNTFSNEVGLFEMSNRASARICEFRRVGHPGSERVSGIYGTKGSYEENLAGMVWATTTTVERVDPPQHFEPLPEPVARDLGGHGGSHAYLVHEFVDSVNRQRMPRINVWESVRYCAPGIVAHESSMRDGEKLMIPDWGDAPA